MDNEYSDVSVEKLDPEWFKWVIHKQGWSIRKLGADGDTGKTDKTIRRAIKAERIRPELLDRIARKLDDYPPYLAGRYVWTLKLSIMDEEGVCDYWRDTYLGPKHFISLCFANSIEDVLRNYFLRFAVYQSVVLRCLGNEVAPSLEASTPRNNEMVKFGSDTPKFNYLSNRLVSRKKILTVKTTGNTTPTYLTRRDKKTRQGGWVSTGSSTDGCDGPRCGLCL